MPISDHPVRITGQETRRLADMAGVHMDLRTVTGTCAQLGRKLEREGEQRLDMLVAEAMQSHALIRYGRCFRGGVRTAFFIPADWIEELPAELRQAHFDILDLRDKHIAHSVNDWELNVPVARVRVDRDTGAVTVGSVSVNQHRVVLLARESIDRLWHLAKALADRVESEMKLEQARLVEYAKAIPVEELRRRIREDPADIPGIRKPSNARGRG